MDGHRRSYKYFKQTGTVIILTSFKVLENDDYKITLVEDYPSVRKEQLSMRERYHIENTVCVNKIVPTRTRQEYYQDNEETILKYYQDNKKNIKKK